MELGFPDFSGIDFISFFWSFMENGLSIIIGSAQWLIDSVGGNVLAAALIVGLIIYVIIDLIYHKGLDIPAAKAGGFTTNIGKKVIIFLMIAAVAYVMLKMAG